MSLAQPAFDQNAERHCKPAEVRTEKVSAHQNTPRGAVARLMEQYSRTAFQATDCAQPPRKAPKKNCEQPPVGILPSNGNMRLRNTDIPGEMPALRQTRASGTSGTSHSQKISADREGRQAAKAPKLMEQLTGRKWTNSPTKSSGFVTHPDRANTDFHLRKNLRKDLRFAEMVRANLDQTTRIAVADLMEMPELGETSQRRRFSNTMASVRAQLVMHLTSMTDAKKAAEAERRSLRSNKGEFLDDREPIVYEEPVDFLQETSDWMSAECDAWGEEEQEEELNVLMDKYPEADAAPLTREEIYADLLTPEGDGTWTPPDEIYERLAVKYADMLTPPEPQADYDSRLTERHRGNMRLPKTNSGNGAMHGVDWASHPEMRGTRISPRILGHELDAQF